MDSRGVFQGLISTHVKSNEEEDVSDELEEENQEETNGKSRPKSNSLTKSNGGPKRKLSGDKVEILWKIPS